MSLKSLVLRSVSTERQFLSDFVVANEKSAGGRLARWLSPAPFVEPEKCELKPPTTPARPSTRLTLPVIVRDQYGDAVMSPALKVEVRNTPLRRMTPPDTTCLYGKLKPIIASLVTNTAIRWCRSRPRDEILLRCPCRCCWRWYSPWTNAYLSVSIHIATADRNLLETNRLSI